MGGKARVRWRIVLLPSGTAEAESESESEFGSESKSGPGPRRGGGGGLSVRRTMVTVRVLRW